jgi:hypothetical protein
VIINDMLNAAEEARRIEAAVRRLAVVRPFMTANERMRVAKALRDLAGDLDHDVGVRLNVFNPRRDHR